MDLSTLHFLVDAGVAGVILFAFMMGWIIPKQTHDELKERYEEKSRAYDLERARSDAATVAAATANQLISALKEMFEKKGADA